MSTQQAMNQGDADPALMLRDIDKRFGATHALDTVSLDAGRGRVHALLGGNGSGKSTLVKILAGVHRGDAGTLGIAGTSCSATQFSPSQARALGLRFVHQNPAVFATMSVAENIALGHSYPRAGGRVDWRALHKSTTATLERYEIAARSQDVLGDLRPAVQTMIAIARALKDEAHGAISVLVLDEPTAALPRHEVELVLAAIRRCAAADQAILLVSHRIDEVMAVSDDVSVLRDGKLILTQPMAQVTEGELVQAIAGRALIEAARRTGLTSPSGDGGHNATPVICKCEHIQGEPLTDVNLSVHEGEVVGIAGLLGSGRTELLQMLFGHRQPDSGSIHVDGTATTIHDPGKAMDLGIAYVPEDREADALYDRLSVRENLSIAQLGRYWKGMHFRHARERRDAQESIDEFTIQTSGAEEVMTSLSGGNQQKVILARWFRRNPRLLLLDEPTQGVDVGARADLHASIRKATDRGAGVLLVSSDFDELATVADRVIVLRDGVTTVEVTGPDLTAETLTELVYSSEETTW